MRIWIISLVVAGLAWNCDWTYASAFDSGGPHFLHIDSGFELEYNDNLFFSPDRQEEDLITTGTLGLDAGYKTERIELRLRPLWRFYKYLDEEDLDDNDQIYRAHFDYQATPRLSFNTEGAYINDNRRDDQVVDTGVVFENIERSRWEAMASTEYLLTEKAAFNASGQYWNDDYNDDVQERGRSSSFSDMEAYGGSAGYTHLLGLFYRPTFLRLNAGYYNFDYDTAETDYYYFTIGASVELNEKLTFLAEAGPRYTDSDYDVARRESITTPPFSRIVIDQESSSEWGSNWLVNLIYRGERTKWESLFSREITASSGDTQTVEQTELRLDLNHRWTGDWSTNLSMHYYLKESDRENSDIDDDSEDTLVVQPGVRYRINNDWFVQGTYRYTWREDNDIDESWDRNQVILQVGHNWKIWE